MATPPDTSENLDDICARQPELPPQSTAPASPPIFMASVYRCESPEQAERLLAGELAGYVYSRGGHPNASLLAEKCRSLHQAERATVCSSGMAALALAAVSHVKAGDHVVVGNQLYGRSGQFFVNEMTRLAVDCTSVDTCELAATASAMQSNTTLIVAETITNPLLRVSDIAGLAQLAHRRSALLLIDNTLATPVVCRPMTLGADLVVESLTKLMSGHSDVMLGLLCGREHLWPRVTSVQSTWGWSTSPFDCWLALRGLGTLGLRAERAIANSAAVAAFLHKHAKVERVDYPGLATHADHDLAARQFLGRWGTMVTFHLRGGMAEAERFIAAARSIPFCPSLGDLSTTLSHPASTSHRSLSSPERATLGISDATIRLSIGIESSEAILAALEEGLAAIV